MNNCEVNLNLLDGNDLDSINMDIHCLNPNASARDVAAYSTTSGSNISTSDEPQPMEVSASIGEFELQHGIELRWSDLSYYAKSSSLNPFSAKKNKPLIRNLNGSIRNGQLTAIIGPSGAGKTTLIECLSGRRITGVTGDITVVYNGISKNTIKISYYSQQDSLYERLTVEESLLYASKLCYCMKSSRDHKNPIFDDVNFNRFLPDGEHAIQMDEIDLNLLPEDLYHRIVVDRVLEELNLRNCASTSVGKISGGQKRRLSIALELIFSPTIFLLDEPTSGLDSLSSLQCIATLKKLVDNAHRPMIVATSIHQPTAKLMSYFDHLYIISHNGQCIYNGPARNLVDTLSNFSLNCPRYHNPADFVVEIASGEFGDEGIDRLASHFKSVCEEQSHRLVESERSISIKKLVIKTQQHNFFKQLITTWILTKRSFVMNTRDPHAYISRLITILATLALISVLYQDEKIGSLNGCVNRPTKDMLDQALNLELFTTEHAYYSNFGFLFYSVILMVFMSILPTLLSFPLEVSVFIKENFNGWYSLKSYYIARNIAELPPIFFFPILYGSVSFYLTGQYFVVWRFLLYNFILICVTFLAQGVGFVVAAYFVNNVTQSTVVGAIINIPLFLFTGLLIKISTMPGYFQPFTYLSYFRLAFESLLVIVYGLDRCAPVKPIDLKYLRQEFGSNMLDMYTCISEIDQEAADNITSLIDTYNNKFLYSINHTSNSYALKTFEYNDDILYTNLLAMIIYMFILRFGGYWVLRCKTKIQ